MDNPVNRQELSLDRFFAQLETFAHAYVEWTSEVPKTLVINPDTMQYLSRLEGFYQRKELAAMVPSHSPLVRHFRLYFGVVLIQEDWEEKFYHFE